MRGWERAFYAQRGGELGVCHARLLSRLQQLALLEGGLHASVGSGCNSGASVCVSWRIVVVRFAVPHWSKAEVQCLDIETLILPLNPWATYQEALSRSIATFSTKLTRSVTGTCSWGFEQSPPLLA